MLTLIRRPKGNRISDTVNTTYDIGSDGYGSALLHSGSGLSNGQLVQIRNSYTSYNGFWLLSSFGSGFRLYEYAGSAPMPYRQDVSGANVYPSVGEIKQSCVHLPIQYVLESSKFPTNSFDTTRFIEAFYNDNGFIKITVSGAITNCEVLDYLYISGTSVDELDGAFQILTKHSTTQFTISAPYAAASGSVYTYSSATAVKYYPNYSAKLRIYGGLPTGHEWQELKPYELIVEESIKPDTSNVIKYNVADKLKEKIEIQFNRPNYDSMPYDLDRFCLFYIEYAESYDISDGATVSTFTDTYTSDRLNFEGMAIDAKNEFKDRYSGYLAEFTYCDDDHPARFLTDAVQPVLFDGWPFDLSFINSMGVSVLYLKERLYDESGTLLSETNTEFDGYSSEGIMRLPISYEDGVYKEVSIIDRLFLLNATLWEDRPPDNTFSKSLDTFVFSTSVDEVYSAEQDVTGIDINDFNTIVSTLNVTTLEPGATVIAQMAIYGSDGNGRVGSRVVGSAGAYDLTLTDSSTTTFDLSRANILLLKVTIVGLVLGPADGDVVIDNGFAISDGLQYTEVKRIDINQDCYGEYIYLEWKNKRGGFDKWLFTAFKDYAVNILDTQEKDRNIYPEWEKSYNEFADTITEETSRTSRQEIVVRSQNVTEDQINYISGIKMSALVNQVTSLYDRRRVIVDKSGFTIKKDGDKLYNITFTIRFTNNIASQSL